MKILSNVLLLFTLFLSGCPKWEIDLDKSSGPEGFICLNRKCSPVPDNWLGGAEYSSKSECEADCGKVPDGGDCGSYNGPLFDIQADGFCQAAFAAKCSNDQQAVDQYCRLYRSMVTSGAPSCPYCN